MIERLSIAFNLNAPRDIIFSRRRKMCISILRRFNNSAFFDTCFQVSNRVFYGFMPCRNANVRSLIKVNNNTIKFRHGAFSSSLSCTNRVFFICRNAFSMPLQCVKTTGLCSCQFLRLSALQCILLSARAVQSSAD